MNLLVPSELPIAGTLRAHHARALLNLRIRAAAARLSQRYPSSARPLAEPPPGSGLKPIMGDYGLPGIGHLFSSLGDSLDFSLERFERYGPVSWFGIFGRPVVGIGSPEAAEVVLLDRKHVFSAQLGYEYLIGPFFHGGILLRDFDEHLHHRRILQQVFGRPSLVGYLDLTTPHLESGMAQWRPGRDFRLYDHVRQLLLEQATTVFAGARLGPEGTRLSHAFEAAVRGGQAMIRADVPGGIWRKGLRGRRLLENYFYRELPAKRAGDGADLFSVLCRAAAREDDFTDADIVSHMIFVMMAAHDTSTIAISMLAYELARHTEWQERLRAESLALPEDCLTYDDLDRLPGLDLAFRETLRMHAPVGQEVREAIADTEILGYHVPRGTLVMIGTGPLMRHDEYWSEPDVFDPERFTAARQEDKSHRYAWSPFGGGAHKCIGMYFGGMTVKSVLHRMLRHYRWTVPPGYRVPLTFGTGPLPADGLPIRLLPL
ncbi:cytochrome P450 [Nocardia huaxiensis]|uniref:Cytochrome P450 n=1 Tax=Nocardia huaxiensis TaxID=2755382 RepID=A0A7D6VAN2_9NOCA|nr:cytochrome P450 [Nocardia huaxiensis]QLY27635.1 cytochrome P450 [Nocardia huaxiensis]UFS98981.1 cytochrome P450 [Nocardia huaxiensis]